MEKKSIRYIIDTVTAFELVKPNGNVVIVTKDSDPKKISGLKVRPSCCQNLEFADASSV